MKQFYTMLSFGSFKIINRETNKFVVSYNKKVDAEKIANYLNAGNSAEKIAILKTKKGYYNLIKK